ncbi:MAG: metalloprotease family protein [Candidatus Lokiarchaeota archaeon]|nr:metalloprotease family protein [Candidatus Lokiarchaeota archaeon]
MYLSINIWLWFIDIWIASRVTFLVVRSSTGLIRFIVNILFFFGVFIHEFSHLMFCFIFRVPTNGMKIYFMDRDRDVVSPGGYVNLAEGSRISMMQSLMIGIAPLFISTFLFMGCLDIIFTFESTFEVQIFVIILAISLILTAAPSQVDVSNIFTAAAGDPLQSFLQFLAALGSLLISINIVNLSGIILALEVLYYVSYFILTIIIYSIIILFCRMIRVIFRRVFPSDNFSSKQILRKRHKPKKPPKHEEGSW